MALRFASGLGLLAMQASAMVLPIPGDARGHGTSLERLTEGGASIELAREILAPGSVIDCQTSQRSTKDRDGAAAAISSFIEGAAAANATIGVNECLDSDAEGIQVKLCNRGSQPAAVPLEQTVTAFDAVRDHCGAIGDITSGDGWVFRISRKDNHKRVRRAAGLERRDCMERGSPEITACEKDVCDPVHVTDENGDCQEPEGGFERATRECYSYCEKKAYKFYGDGEADTDLDYCNGRDCTLSEGTTILYTELFSVTVGPTMGLSKLFTGSLAIGVGWTWGKSEGTTTTQTQTFGEGKCGYWWKVPVMVNSCGTFTNRVAVKSGSISGSLDCADHPQFRIESEESCSVNIATVPGTERDDIVVIPRYTTCDTREYLPDDEQSEEYKRIYVDGDLASSDGSGPHCVGADEDPDEFNGGIVIP